jgi:DME family drug/metabolite transporter
VVFSRGEFASGLPKYEIFFKQERSFMETQSASRRGLLLVIFASISWGTIGVGNQALYAYSATNALSLALLRLAIAAPLFLFSAWSVLGWRLFRIKLDDLGVMLFMGGLQAIYQISYSSAVSYTGVTISTLVAICVAPVVVVLFSLLIAREYLKPIVLLALAAALSGTILLVIARGYPLKESLSLLGVLLALLAACCYAGFVLCARRFAKRYHSLQINTIVFTVGALALLGFALTGKVIITYSGWQWLLLFYLGSIPTALAYGLFQIGTRSLSATMVSIATLCEPLTAVLLAWILFHENLSALGLLGTILLCGAMLLILVFPAG